jgi:anti-sigma B factor antagonist
MKNFVVVRTAQRYNVCILALKNRYDVPEGVLLEDKVRELLNLKHDKFVFDFSEIVWMNASNLGCLKSVSNIIKNHGGNLKLAIVQEKVKNLLEVTKLITLFEVYNSVGAALESFQSQT